MINDWNYLEMKKKTTTHKSFTVIDLVLDRYEKSANIPSSTRFLQRSFWNRLLRHFFTSHARQMWYFIICHSAIFLHSIESLNPSMCVRSWWNMTPAVNREPCHSERWYEFQDSQVMWYEPLFCGGPEGPTLGVAGVSELRNPQTQGHKSFTGRVARASLEAWQFSLDKCVWDTGDSHMPGSDRVLDLNLLPRG